MIAQRATLRPSERRRAEKILTMVSRWWLENLFLPARREIDAARYTHTHSSQSCFASPPTAFYLHLKSLFIRYVTTGSRIKTSKLSAFFLSPSLSAAAGIPRGTCTIAIAINHSSMAEFSFSVSAARSYISLCGRPRSRRTLGPFATRLSPGCAQLLSSPLDSLSNNNFGS
jgi:hypothetical protein